MYYIINMCIFNVIQAICIGFYIKFYEYRIVVNYFLYLYRIITNE